MTFQVPASLAEWHQRPGGSAWLAALPSIIETCVERWGLRLQAPFADANVSFVAPVMLRDGSEAVLKVNFPHRETECEPDALAHWAGRGAVRLLRSNPENKALLVERCRPGTQLWQLVEAGEEDEATRVWISAASRIWRPAPREHRFLLLSDEAKRWAEQIPEDFAHLSEPEDRAMVQATVEALTGELTGQGEQVVLHQDFHGGNILRAEREPWLVIDPKPLVGEREFDVEGFLCDGPALLSQPDAAAIVQRRFDMVTNDLGLDRRRVRLWALVHLLAWGVTRGGVIESHVEAARLVWRLRI